jgi:hypothetical protein
VVTKFNAAVVFVHGADNRSKADIARRSGIDNGMSDLSRPHTVLISDWAYT